MLLYEDEEFSSDQDGSKMAQQMVMFTQIQT